MRKKPKAAQKSEIDHDAEAQKARTHLRNDKDLNKAYPLEDRLQCEIADKGNQHG